jgi:membrane protein DedA with SNARE-associated domain
MAMPSLLLPAPLLSLLPTFPLLAVFVLLSLGIWLIPFAEELALLTAGYLYYSGQSPFLLVLGVTGTGLFLGDFLAFQVGRSCRRWQGAGASLGSGSSRWGGLLASWVARYGVSAVFWARFLPGVRLATYVLAGLTGMPVGPYVRVTLLAGGVYVPLMLLLAASWGAEIDAALQAVHQVGLVTWGLVSIGISIGVLFQCWRSWGAVPLYRRSPL